MLAWGGMDSKGQLVSETGWEPGRGIRGVSGPLGGVMLEDSVPASLFAVTWLTVLRSGGFDAKSGTSF